MAEKKHCLRCQRPIDEYARICPYCNWDQSELKPPTAAEQAPAPAYVPPAEQNWKRRGLFGAGAVVVLIALFAIGAFIQGKSAPKKLPGEPDRPQAQAGAPVGAAPHADVTLVPVGDAGVEAPITSAPITNPAEGVPTEYQRSDATAVSSVEYAQLAARAQQEKKKQQALLDPRSVKGQAYDQGPRSTRDQQQTTSNPPSQISSSSAEPEPAESRPEDSRAAQVPSREPARVIVSTRPVAEYQPVPDIHVSESATVRLDLLVGADGRVKDVTIRNTIPGQTAKIISTVQNWRFKPGTENGVPVTAPFSVDISFRGND